MTKEQIINYLKMHKEKFQKEYEVEQIGLFGSYARDEAREDSDIDIFVQMKPDFLLCQNHILAQITALRSKPSALSFF